MPRHPLYALSSLTYLESVDETSALLVEFTDSHTRRVLLVQLSTLIEALIPRLSLIVCALLINFR